MAVGKGGSSGSQSGSSNETTNYSGTGSFEEEGYVRPVAPEGWEGYWQGAAPNPQDVADANAYSRAMMGRDSHTLATLADMYPDQYSEIDPVAAQQVSAEGTDAQQALGLIGGYSDLYGSELIDPTLSAYDQEVAEARNALTANNAGAFGNKRTGVSEGQFESDAILGRGGLRSDLLRGGLDWAGGLATGDVNRILTSDMSDADRMLAASGMNQSANLNAQQFNNNMQNQRQMFDVDAAYRGDELRDQAGRDVRGGGMDWLGIGTSLFGQDSGSSGTNEQSGTSNTRGTSRGNSSSKSGGISAG